MANLPNIELTKDELSYFMNERTNLLGAEGKVFTGLHQGEARKIFYYPFNGTTRELEEFYNEMDNKRKKLIALSEKKLNNDIVPIATLSYDDVMVGYDMTSPNLRKATHYDIKKLERLKQRIKAFHEVGIVHGDIKESNILINSAGDLVLCDLDNMQVDDYPIDYLNYMIEYFPNDDRLVSQNADIYLYNLFFLKQLFFQEKEYDEIADDIIYEKFPKELRGESLEELYKMQQCFVDYQGNYLIDTYTKRKK